MQRKFISLIVAAVAIAGVLFFSPAGEDSDFVAQITPAAADAGECKTDAVLRAASLTREAIDRRQWTALQQWCARMDSRDTAQTTVTAAPSPSGPVGSGTIVSPSRDPSAIWCGKQVCACWKGKYYDGCHHLSVCTSPLTCYGKVCVCKTSG